MNALLVTMSNSIRAFSSSRTSQEGCGAYIETGSGEAEVGNAETQRWRNEHSGDSLCPLLFPHI